MSYIELVCLLHTAKHSPFSNELRDAEFVKPRYKVFLAVPVFKRIAANEAELLSMLRVLNIDNSFAAVAR